MRPRYWARIQSSLNRFATWIVTLDRSSATCAFNGLIQVLNCCSGSSCASCSTQLSHRLLPASAPPGPARLPFCPPLLLVVLRCGSPLAPPPPLLRPRPL